MTVSPLFVQSLEKGLQVLESFRRSDAMNLQEIAAAAGISVSSAQRMVFTLEQLGYLVKDPAVRRYRLAVKVMDMGHAYLASESLFQFAHAILHKVHQECGESVNLSVPDGNDMVFVMRVHTFRHIPVYMPTGTRIPILASASGRAVLAALPQDECEHFLRGARVAKHTVHTTTSIPTLRSLVAKARGDGYAYADEEFYPGDVNVAAAILDTAGRPVAAVNISVPKPRWTVERAREELAPLAVRAARAIGQG